MHQSVIVVLALCLFASLSTCQGAGDFKLNHRQLRALKTSFSEKLIAASTKTSDAAPEYQNEYYADYKPVKTKSLCFTEVGRRQCVAVGAGGPNNDTFIPAGRLQISDLGCCLETSSGKPIAVGDYDVGREFENDEYQKASASSYGPEGPYIDYGKDYDLVLPYGDDFACSWEITYAEFPVEVTKDIFHIGSARATCYFNKTAEDCSSLKDGTIITAETDMFWVLALSKEPFVPINLDPLCNATYGGIGGGGPGNLTQAMRSKLKAVVGSDVKLQGYDYEHDDYRNPIHYPVPGSEYYGLAILLSGPITSITNLQHKTEYKTGVLQYVPFYSGVRIEPFMVVPPDTPLIKPSSYKIVLASEDY